MAPARYEVRVNGALSERARDAFSALDVRSVPPQTIVFGELAEQSVWVPRTRSPHATCTYSWTRPPSRSRRRTRMAVPGPGGPPAGGR